MSKVTWWDSEVYTSRQVEGKVMDLDTDETNNDNMNIGTDVDGMMDHSQYSEEGRMESESPSSELENLAADNSSDNESMKSGKDGIYVVNTASESESKGFGVDIGLEVVGGNNSVDIGLEVVGGTNSVDIGKENISDNVGSVKSDSTDPEGRSSVDSKEPAEKKMKKENRRVTDSFLFERGPSEGSGKLNETFSGSRPDSAASSSKSGTPGKDVKDPARKEKEKEREDRIKQAQQKLAEDRQRKIEEMREQQRLAQENREKQLDARRKKIEELKRREEERRKQVEERRRTQEETDRAKKEAILSKAKERLTRYEQWKTHGRKGYPGDSPPSKKLSQSTSVLYHKRSPDFSSSGTLNTAGTGTMKGGAESMMALHAIPENRLGRSFVASALPTRHKSSVNLTGVKMRDPSKTSPRKPRPSSVATSMPSFVRVEMDSTPKSTRSRSTDRGAREHSKSRVSIRVEEDKTDGKERKAATLPRPYDRKKIEERRQEVKKKQEERKEKEKEKERMTKSDIQDESRDKDKPPPRLSKSFIERMSVPKRSPVAEKKESPAKETTPVKVARRSGPVEAPAPHKQEAKVTVKDKPPKIPKDSPTKVKVDAKDTKVKDDSTDSRSGTPKSISPAPSGTPPARVTPTIQVEEVKDSLDEPAETVEGSERTKSPSQDRVPSPVTPPRAKPESKQATPEPKPSPKADAKPKTDKEREMEEYKAKLAEKRRMAREKAEREAEIERLRQEEMQRQEEERLREEEERQRREEEEALRLAADAREAEEERLQKAIEAEEKRKREEAERMEQDRIAKEEAEKKTKEEAERREREMQERAKREEEERNERRKRLEMIMKRVKTDTPGSSPDKTRTESPTRVITSSSSRTSLVSSEDEKADDSEKDERTDGLRPDDRSDDTHKFKSPLLQKLTESKAQNGDSGTPKFKSPLLQSIMGKTKIGSRLSGTRLDEMDKSTENLSVSKSTDSLSRSSENLSDKEKDQDPDKDKDTSDPVVSNGLTRSDKCDSGDKLLEDDSSVSRGDVDSHDTAKTVISEGNGEIVGPLVCDSMTASVPSQGGVTDSQILIGSTADSAVSLSFNGVSTSHNGDIHIEATELIDSKDLVDSSISVRTVDSPESPQTGSSVGVGLHDTQIAPESDTSPFEEIIDLNTVPSRPLKGSAQLGDSLLNHSGDSLNINNLAGIDNGHMSGAGDASSTVPVTKPIIAFEDNATRQDVPDLLS